jgi:hypothetical protein
MPESAFEVFLGRNNARCVQLLEQNHDVSGFFQGLLERFVEHCNQHGATFDRLVVDNPVVTEDGYVQFRLRV